MNNIRLFETEAEMNACASTTYVSVLCANKGNGKTLLSQTIPQNEIWYKTTDGNTADYGRCISELKSILPKYNYHGPEIVSEEYDNALGFYRIKFFTNITELTTSQNLTTGCTTFFCDVTKGASDYKNYTGYLVANKLTEIIIPEGVTTIGLNTFSGCENLKHIHIPSTVTTIGVSAFAYCASLPHIVLPPNLTSMGAYCLHQAGVNKITITGNQTIQTMNHLTDGAPANGIIYQKYGTTPQLTELQWTLVNY